MPIASTVESIFVKRAVRFAFSGLLVTALHVLVAAAFINIVLPEPSLANGVAFIVATITSYLINTKWSFSSQLHSRSLFRFSTVSILGFFIAIGIAGVVELLGFSYWYGITAVVCVIPPISFLMHQFWTYK